MGFPIRCCNALCEKESWAVNIVDLVDNYRDDKGWLRCPHCKESSGYIIKEYALQEKSQTFSPIIRGILMLNEDRADSYQPFAYIVTYEDPMNREFDVMIAYFKDTRNEPEGRLKTGHGPGGVPVLGKEMFYSLMKKLVAVGCLSKNEIINELLEI